jgi:hypothetical protein
MNITNINILLRAYFIENKKRWLILGIIIFGVTVFFYTLPSVPEDVRDFPFYLWFWIAGTFFQPYLRKNSSTHFFSFPASIVEKFIHAVVVVLFAGVVIELLTLAGACIGQHLIRSFFYFYESNVSIWEFNSAKKFEYLLNIAVAMAFLYGSIYFRKHAFIKTLAIGIGVLFAVAIYFRVMERIIYGELLNNSAPVAELFLFPNFHFFFLCILTLFFLFLTYLRLRKTEV